MEDIARKASACVVVLMTLSAFSTALAQTSTVPASFQTNYVKSGEALLQVQIIGKGEPILLVPGFARGAADYEAIMTRLAALGYQAIAVNARGCEGSTGPWAKTTMYEIADDLYAVIKGLDLGPVHVVGHAAGGRYARMLATRHPETVRSVVILSSGGQFEDKKHFDIFIEAVFKTIRGEISPVQMDEAMMRSGAFAPGNDPSPWRTGWWPVASAQAKAGGEVKSDEFAKAGGRPILALYGKEDGVAPPKNSLVLTESLGDQVTIVGVDHAAHNMHQEQPKVIVDAIDEWVKKHPSH